MKTSQLVKINFILLGLFVTFFAIYHLNKKGLGHTPLAVLGLSQATATGQKISWCDTRVEALIKPNEFKIAQEKNKWLVEKEHVEELSFLSVERWFGEHCSVKGEIVPTTAQTAQASASSAPVLLVKFITGDIEALRRNADGRYLWKDRVFTSKAMDQALEELTTLSRTGQPVAE